MPTDTSKRKKQKTLLFINKTSREGSPERYIQTIAALLKAHITGKTKASSSFAPARAEWKTEHRRGDLPPPSGMVSVRADGDEDLHQLPETMGPFFHGEWRAVGAASTHSYLFQPKGCEWRFPGSQTSTSAQE